MARNFQLKWYRRCEQIMTAWLNAGDNDTQIMEIKCFCGDTYDLVQLYFYDRKRNRSLLTELWSDLTDDILEERYNDAFNFVFKYEADK